MSWLRSHAAPIAVAALALAGLALRFELCRESVFADELSTLSIVSTNGLGGVWSAVHTNTEITPPLYFLAAWVASQLYDAPEITRLPALLAGVATIPAVYLLGLRTVPRQAALTAAAVVTLSPFAIYYSAEARGYALMILLVALSTLSLLLAVDTRKRRWWIAYAACSCAAMYTHYTAAFVLLAQLGWLLWAHPEARRAALLANVAAALAFLPWLSGLRADLDSPTTEILSLLSPFDLPRVRSALTHATIGYPDPRLGLRQLPGIVPLVLFAAGVVLGIAGIGAAVARDGLRKRLARLDRRVVLVVALAVVTPLGTALVSIVGTNLFNTRNLAASWPGYALSLGALLVAAGPRLRYVAIASVLACLVVGALDIALSESAERPRFKEVAAYINDHARPSDVVVDGAVLSPGPLSPLDVALGGEPHQVVRLGAPVQRVRPFGVFDRVVPAERVIERAARRAPGRRVFVLYDPDVGSVARSQFPADYRLTARRRFPALRELWVETWEPG